MLLCNVTFDKWWLLQFLCTISLYYILVISSVGELCWFIPWCVEAVGIVIFVLISYLWWPFLRWIFSVNDWGVARACKFMQFPVLFLYPFHLISSNMWFHGMRHIGNQRIHHHKSCNVKFRLTAPSVAFCITIKYICVTHNASTDLYS